MGKTASGVQLYAGKNVCGHTEIPQPMLELENGHVRLKFLDYVSTNQNVQKI